MRQLLLLFSVTIAIMLLSGCTIMRPMRVTPSTSYTLSSWPKNPVAPKQFMTKDTLLVAEPTASPGYQSSKMIYVLIPYELRSFSDHRWVAPPSDLLLPLMAQRLRISGYFQSVVTAPFSGSATYQLNTQLLTLQQEFLQPDSVIRMRIEATLICVRTGQVIANRVFEAVIPAKGNDPYSGVLAANKAAHQILDQIAIFVVKRVKEG